MRSLILALLSLGACAATTDVELNGQRISFRTIEEKRSLRGERVIDMIGLLGRIIPWDKTPEIDATVGEAGLTVARQRCGGAAELDNLVRVQNIFWAANLRYRCL